MPNLTVQMPGTEHPAYARQAAAIRGFLEDRPGQMVLLPRIERNAFATFNKPSEPAVADVRTRTLVPQKAAGPAPFVGDARYQRAFYVWFVASDELGRHIATDAHLEIIDHWDPRLTSGQS